MKHRKSRVRRRLVRRRKVRKPTTQHIVSIPKRLIVSTIKPRMTRVLTSNSSISFNAATSLVCQNQLEMGGGHRFSLGLSAFANPTLAYSGLYNYFSSEYPSGVTTVGQNTGLYSGYRTWAEQIDLEFCFESASAPCTLVFYAYPTSNKMDGTLGTQLYSNIANYKGVKYYRFQSQNTANPIKLSLMALPYKIIGIDESAYTASQYDVTISGGTINLPSLFTASAFWTIGVLALDGAGLSTATVTGVIYIRQKTMLEFFDPNNFSVKVPT